MNIALVGTFGLRPKATISARAIPLAEALIDRGHVVTVVIPPWDNPEDSGREVTIGRVRVLNVSLPPPVPLLWYFILTWRLLIETLRLRPEVVHIFKPKGFSGLVATILWLQNVLGFTSVKVVVDTDDWEGSGGWNEIGDYSFAQRLFFPFQEKMVLRQSEAITVASKALEGMIARLCGDRKKVFYLPNALRTDRYQVETEPRNVIRAKLGLGESPVILLYTRFFEFGISRVPDVLEKVVARLPDARLLVIGRGFFGEEKELERLALERGLASNVLQLGWVDEADLHTYFSVADVAIYPFDDTIVNRTKCSVKLLDLLNARVPVVADRVGQNAEYIDEDSGTGILTESGNSTEMASAVVKIVTEPELAKRLGCEAQRRIRSKFTWEVWAPQAENAYLYAAKRKSVARLALAWLPVILWMGAIFYMSAQPSPPQIPQPILQTIAAKLVHLGEYAVLAMLLFRAYRLSIFLPGNLRHAIVFAVLVSALYASSDEFHQSFVPNRHPSPIDVLIDTAGASLALGVIWQHIKRLRRFAQG